MAFLRLFLAVLQPLLFVLPSVVAGGGGGGGGGAAQMCYFPDGTPASKDFVCNSQSGDGFSSCCGYQADQSQAYCMSNGLCLSDMFLSRGSCTDKTFTSPNCAQVCTNVNRNSGIGIRPCGYQGTWTCGSNENGTDCASNQFKIVTGTFELTPQQLKSMGLSVPSTAAGAASGPDPMVATVGAAVGVPLGLAALAALALYLFERRRSLRLAKHLEAQQQQMAMQASSSPPPRYGGMPTNPTYHHELDGGADDKASGLA